MIQDIDTLKRLKYWNDDYKQNASFEWTGNGVITENNPAKTLVCTIPADSFYAIDYGSNRALSDVYCTLFIDGVSVGSYTYYEGHKTHGENTYPGLKYTDKAIQVHITCYDGFIQNGTPLNNVNPGNAYARECSVMWFNPKIQPHS